MSVDVMDPSTSAAPWKKYHQSIMSALAVERLREACKQQDASQLEAALAAARHAGITDTPDVTHAQHTLNVIRTRQELVSAVRSHDREQLETAITNAEKQGKGLVKNVQQELMEAKNKLLALKRMQNSDNVMVFSQKLLSELRSLQNPPDGVKQILHATLLLLGHPEQDDSWGHYKKSLANGLYQSLLSFDPTTLHPEIAARAKEILMAFDMKQIRCVSLVGFTLYIWCLGHIDAVEQEHQEDGRFVAASPARQRELLAPPSPPKRPPTPTLRRLRRQASGGDSLPAPLNMADMVELRQLKYPPQSVKYLMQAFLLLLGHHEEATANYHYCLERLAMKTGKEPLLAKLAAFDVGKVDPKIAARAKELMERNGISVDEIGKNVRSAMSVYQWVAQTIAAVEDSHDGDGAFVPATIAEQKLLFNPAPPRDTNPRKPRPSPSPRNNGDSLKDALQEMKSLGKPPRLVQEILQATLLLQGHDESKTTWGYIKKELARISLTNEELTIHPEIAARVRQMLPESEGVVKRVSAAAATFYNWCQKTIVGVGEEATPASLRRQRQIFLAARGPEKGSLSRSPPRSPTSPRSPRSPGSPRSPRSARSNSGGSN